MCVYDMCVCVTSATDASDAKSFLLSRQFHMNTLEPVMTSRRVKPSGAGFALQLRLARHPANMEVSAGLG